MSNPMTHSILNGRGIKACDKDTWLQWLTDLSQIREHERLVADSVSGTSRVRTVFVGDCAPLVFQTFVEGGPMDGHERRYATWEEAETGHRETCEALNKLYV